MIIYRRQKHNLKLKSISQELYQHINIVYKSVIINIAETAMEDVILHTSTLICK